MPQQTSSPHDPAIVAGVLASVEQVIRRALALAPLASRDLEDLAGLVLAIECTQPQVLVFLEVSEDGDIRLTQHSEAELQTRVRGSAEDFVALAVSEDPAATLINSDLEIIGNTAPLLALQQILGKMDIDWEAPIVARLGDVAGHQLAQIIRGLLAWGQQAGSSLRRQLSEFILEEGRLSPPRAELEHFYDEVDKLKLRVERIQSRLERLGRKMKSP